MGRPTRTDVEDFLYHEAALVDEWQLRAWVALFDDHGQYVVPSLDCDPATALDGDPRSMLCLVADDLRLIKARVDRLENTRAHAEHPRTRVRHLVANARPEWSSEDQVEVLSNLAVHWAHHDAEGVYVAKCRHRLRWNGGDSSPEAFRIAERRVVLDAAVVGALSFIL